MTGGVPEDHMFFCGEPTADGDQEAYYLRQWYEANCPELHLGGWLAGLGRWARRIFLGYVDYDVNRDRDHFMGQLADEAARIRKEKVRQLTWLRTGVKPTLRVREGGYYRKGDGQKVGPMFQMGGVWYAKGVQGDWDGYGRGLHGLPPGHPQAHEYDLVAVWEDLT